MKEDPVKLLDQIIEFAQIQDARDKEKDERVGENWMVYHLKLLRGILKKDD